MCIHQNSYLNILIFFLIKNKAYTMLFNSLFIHYKKQITFLVDPLEQFDIFSICLNLTNLSFFLIVILFMISWLHVCLQWDNQKKNWNFLTQIQKQFFKFTENIALTNLILSKHSIFIIYYFIFILIVFANISGLIPFSFTITSSFIITFSMALIILFIINIIAIYIHGFHQFIGFFLPKGTPFAIAILLVFIEIVSYIARLFSLSIRLFANMMAGHTLLKILIGFSFTILFIFSTLSSVAILPWVIVTCIVFLEILIAFLQAYVFLILICIYCNDILQSH